MKYFILLLTLISFSCQSSSTANKDTSKESETVETTESKPVETEVEPIVIERWAATDYRNENWHPEKGQYFFSEAWVWEFLNENLPPDDQHHKGEFWVYVDPPSGTMMLRREDAHYQAEMTDWIIIQPDGKYLTQWTDHDGTKHQETHQVPNFPDHSELMKYQTEDFAKFFKHTGEYENFGDNSYNWETFTGKEWKQSYAKTTEISTVYTTALPFDVRPLYLVEKINGDLKLPLAFSSYAYLLPEGELLLEEMATFYGKKVGFRFKSMSPTEFFLEVN